MFELNKSINFKKIELGVYVTSSGVINNEKANKIDISVSEDKVVWHKSGSSSANFGTDISNVTLSGNKGKFIKFENEYNFGINFLNVKK